jgi:FG-GAP-like repeat
MPRTFLRSALHSCAVVIFLIFLPTASALGQTSNPFFTPPTYPGTGQELAADVNGDGKPDLLFFDGTVLLGKGDGTFTKGVSWNPTPNQGTQQFAIADFNGDGKPDLLTASPSTSLSVFLGNGDGTFQQTMTGVSMPITLFVVGDLNGDGRPDVLAQEGFTFFTFINKGDGTFSAGFPSGATGVLPPFQLADFNHDGKLDLLLGRGLGIQLGNGDGTFQAVTQFPSGILTGSSVIGDFDGDGNLDVLVTAGTFSSLQLQILFGKGDGTFRTGDVQTLPPNIGLSDLVAVDLNGDGKPELVGSTGSTVQVLTNNGSGIFSMVATTTLSTGSQQPRPPTWWSPISITMEKTMSPHTTPCSSATVMTRSKETMRQPERFASMPWAISMATATRTSRRLDLSCLHPQILQSFRRT